MANALFGTWKSNLLSGGSSFSLTGASTQTAPYLVLLSTRYTYVSSHEVYTDLGSTSSGVWASPVQMLTPTVSSATFNSCDVTFLAVTAGATVTALGLIRWVGNSSAQTLPVMYMDTATGLPLTPNGGDVTITWDSNGIFTVSDSSAKENLELYGTYGPAKLYRYNHKGSDITLIGMLAQEVEEWCPEAVMVIDDTKHVDYGKAISRIHEIANGIRPKGSVAKSA